jgi:hypothetical protein
MASDDSEPPAALSRELIALIETVRTAEREREARLEAKLAQLDAHMREADRVQKLITGGASHREARLRALEDMIEAMAAERSRQLQPRPLDLPGRTRFDPSVVDMRGRDPEPGD